jgi:hypothetical protein
MKRCRYKSFAVSYLFACLPILGARVDPPPPCVFHGSEPGECHVSIESELRIKKGTGGFELVVKTKNRSRASVFVVESNARYDFSVAVKDLWGNAVPLTESEKSHRSPLRSTLNFVLELKRLRRRPRNCPCRPCLCSRKPARIRSSLAAIF